MTGMLNPESVHFERNTPAHQNVPRREGHKSAHFKRDGTPVCLLAMSGLFFSTVLHHRSDHVKGQNDFSSTAVWPGQLYDHHLSTD